MALSDKNILITPQIGQSADPRIVFSGADASTAAQNITLAVYPANNGTLSFEGSAGQLFSITNDLTGTIFSVNDISGIPSIEVDASGVIRLAEFSGNVLIGTDVDNGTDRLQVDGDLIADNLKINGYGPVVNSSGQWVGDPDTVRGYTGSQGPVGYTGSLGFTGSQGTTGFTGSRGATGFTGSLGFTGSQGTTGFTGSKGDVGFTGSQGAGFTGSKGDIGFTGSRGFTGSKGDTGFTGSFGTTGFTGSLGFTGSRGVTGFTGSRGETGFTGSIGFTGSRGTILWSRQTANYTAVLGDAVIADTTNGSFTVTLPASPPTGTTVTIADGGDWSVNPLTVARNGSTIENNTNDFLLDIRNVKIDFSYDGTTWQVYSSVGSQQTSDAEILILTTSMAIAFG